MPNEQENPDNLNIPDIPGQEHTSEPTSESSPRDIDKEWAEALQMNYETEWRRDESPLPPPPPGDETPPRSPDPAFQERQGVPSPPPMPQAPLPPAQPIAPANPAGHSEPMPPTHLVWAVLATLFCCLVPGVVAIFFSSSVSSRYYVKDYEGARRASERAEWWIIASVVLGVVSATISLPLMIAGGF